MRSTPRRFVRAFVPLLTCLGAFAASCALTSASAGADALQFTAAVRSIVDPSDDSRWSQGDVVGAAARADTGGTTTVSVTVDTFDSPTSDNWQYAITGVSWNFDVNGDSVRDFYAATWGIGGQVYAQVFDAADHMVCNGSPSSDATARTYTVSFATSCLGNPVRFWWSTVMAYEDADTVMQSIDSAPDLGLAGPVPNEAHPDNLPRCVPSSVGPSGPPTDGFVSLVPTRLLDTRLGMSTIDCAFNGTGRMGGTDEIALTVAGRGGVPADATAVVLNLTATDGANDGFVTAYPCGTQRPDASSLSYSAHATVPNAVIASLGADGKVCLFSNAEIDLIADVNGYFTDDAGFVPANPSRVYDSRKVGGSIRQAGSETAIGPFDGSSVVLNVTVTEPRTDGYATVYPCGSPRPLASNLNFTTDTTAANAVIAKIGDAGMVCVFTSATAHLVVDINGSYTVGAGYTSMVPQRLLDTRSGLATVDGLANGVGLVDGPTVLALQVAGRGDVPSDASAVVLNVTVDDARGNGFITAFPCGSPQPNASSLNYVVGSTAPNAVVIQVGTGGRVCFYSNAPTHLIVDVNGYYPGA